MLSDMGEFTRGVLLLSLLSLVKANSSPTIHTSVYFVCEDTPIDHQAFTIDASDPENDPLTFTLTGVNAGLFQVEAGTGIVTVKSHLDREAESTISLGVTISDTLNVIRGNLIVVLEDANDNKPTFLQPSYDMDLRENTVVGTSLFRAEAEDYDSGNAGAIRYSIDEITPPIGVNPFSIVSTTGEVKLSGQLNYTSLSTFYRLRIKAADGGGNCYFDEVVFHTSTVFSFINVLDVPDLDPEFISTPYVGTVEENSPVGHTVFTVIALDQDTGINDAMIYSIESSTVDGLFTISPDGGVITVLSHIDREVVGDTVILTVKATETNLNIHGIQASTTAEVLINILDINDNPPAFYKCGAICETATEFTGEVSEHSLGAISFDMTVKDLDKNSQTELTLEGQYKDVFSVQPSLTVTDSIVQLLVSQPENLDYEKTHQMILQVIAVDKEEDSFRSTATVTINILDTNDHSPMFPKDTYDLRVEEHSPVGTVVANITAEDPDTMDQGNLTYKLFPESMLLYFDVEPRTGSVYVKDSDLLDREVRSLYSPTLQARDTDNKPGTTVLEITLIDINDQPPVITRNSYLEFVKEGGQLEVVIEATDADEPNTPNSQIQFRIDPGKYSNNFTINPDTGVLQNQGELDREALDPDLNGRMELNVTAVDKGDPPLSSTVPVLINVEDVNDNAPQFNAPSYSFSVKEGDKGVFVGSVQAEDLDQTVEFNRISFSIMDGSAGRFIIRTFADVKGYRGNITVDPDIELDYESTPGPFRMQVEAADLEQKKAVVVVEVNVLDVNDERPEFNSIQPVSVKENTTIIEAIGRFTAHDKDTNHSLIYELESVTCRCKNSEINCSWFVLDPNGDVRVNPEHTVDYEECEQAVVEAQVVDVYTEKGENNSATPGQMVINIEDINDNAPQFVYSDAVFIVVSETTSKGTSVATVTGTDRDSGINKQMEFKVAKVQFENTENQISDMTGIFEVVTTQQSDSYVGIIQTLDSLNTELKGKYLITVTATDTGGLATSTVLDIFTIDGSYKIELHFSISVAEVQTKLDEIVRELISATKASVEIAAIRSVTDEAARSTEKTMLVVYFVYRNGTALSFNEVYNMLTHGDHYPILKQLGLDIVGDISEVETAPNPEIYALLGMVGGLIIVLAVLTTSLICTRRNYGRKLKAAKAMNSVSKVTFDNQKSGPVVPGTNKYTMEGANPVLNLHIDTALALDMDTESSDVDKVSLNSLDNDYDMMTSDKDTSSVMQKIEEETEDDGPPEYSEPLGAALAQLGHKKRGDKGRAAFENPAFDTTDL